MRTLTNGGEVMNGDWQDPAPYLRGLSWQYEGRPVRADPGDRLRLPLDVWERAALPAGVRLELTAGAGARFEVRYRASEPGPAEALRVAEPVFEAWRGDVPLERVPAKIGDDETVRLTLPPGVGPVTVHLPESLSPVVLGVRGRGIAPAPPRPRWVVHGDSITEGWLAGRPALSWLSAAGRALGLDPVNLGYAGSAHGEAACAEQIATLHCELITLAFGTNCWSGVPASAPLLYETTRTFLDLVRQGHPETPLLVVSPPLRPEAEEAPNRLGATLGELRDAQESAVLERAAAGDRRLALLPGLRLLGPHHLADGLHPNDDGHAVLATAVSDALHMAGFLPLPASASTAA